ncbi:MAG: PEP-CTERM sorting domain-containing protein [Phycisphaerales bacterium]|nr:PEP-CTERM sorting domain-containing protein [Planctomycetota bacterium]
MKTIACVGAVCVCVAARGDVLLSARPLVLDTFVNFITPPATAPTTFSVAMKPNTPSGFVALTPTIRWDIPVTTVGAWSGDVNSSDPNFAACASIMSDGVPTTAPNGLWFVWGTVGINYPTGFGGGQVIPSFPGPVGSTIDFFPYTITRFRLVVSGFSYVETMNTAGKVSYTTKGNAMIEVWGVPAPGTTGALGLGGWGLLAACRRRR